MESVEEGVRESLRKLGVADPKTALEMLAVELGKAIDDCDQDKLAALSRELRLTLIQIEETSGDLGDDKVRALMDKNR